MNQLCFYKFISFIITGVLFFNCTKPTAVLPATGSGSDTAQPAPSTPTETNPINILALGDSYTIGQSVDSLSRFPAQTAAILQNKGVAVSNVRYIATTGWTTINLLSAIETQNPVGPFAAVTLLIGVNDQYKARDTTNYRQNFARVLLKAIQLTGNKNSRVFVLSIPDYSVTPFGGNDKETSLQIDQFNAINKDVARRYGISYTDVTDISRQDANQPDMICYDGLHPSGKQYAQWAETLAPVMFEALK